MAIRLTTTKESSKYVKCLVIGRSGVGKTKLCSTAPSPVIISAEKGLLSLQDFNIPVIEVSNHKDFEDAYNFIKDDPRAQGFKTVCVDSISDIAESCLAWFKENPVDGNTHPQAAYGHMADAIIPLIKKFRDLDNKHVYFTAKLKRMTDQYSGIDTFMPSAPGQIIGPSLPYLFDFMFPMRIGETENKVKYRYLQTQPDIQFEAKDRSGRLNDIEKPDLSHIFQKALSVEKPPEQPSETPSETPSDNPGNQPKEQPKEQPAETPEENQEENQEEAPEPDSVGEQYPADDEIPF